MPLQFRNTFTDDSSNKKPPVTKKQPVVNTNVDASNLAGTNYKRPVQTSTQAGKTFVPETPNITNGFIAEQNAKKNQAVLNKVADESTRKANNIVNSVTSFVDQKKREFEDSYQDSALYRHDQQINQFKQDRINAKADSVLKENEDKVKSFTEDEWNYAFDENGEARDFTPTINDLKGQISVCDETINGQTGEAVQNEINKRNELQSQLDYILSIQDKVTALEELYAHDQLTKQGDTDTLNSYREQLSHKNDNMWQRAGSALQHLNATTVNLLPESFDQMEQMIYDNTAKAGLAEVNERYKAGDISSEDYQEILGRIQDYTDEHLATNQDNISQQIRAYANQLSANTYYGASDVQKFLLQAGESTAQFLVHYAIGSAVVGSLATQNRLVQAGVKALEKAEAGSSAGLSAGQLALAGRNALGAEVSTFTMSLASATDKMNQLLSQGVDSETASMNAFMTGLTSYLTEKIGMDDLVDALNKPITKNMVGGFLLTFAHAKSSLSEGLEEVVEGLVDPVIDCLTLGTPYEVKGGELLLEFALGATSGLAMSVGGSAMTTASGIANNIKLNSIEDYAGVGRQLANARQSRNNVMAMVGPVDTKILINTKRQREARLQDMRTLASYFDQMTPDQQQVASYLINRAKAEIAEYDSKAVGGVTFSADMPVTYTEEELDRAIVQAFTPDFNDELQLEKKFVDFKNNLNDYIALQQTANEINANTKQILESQGYGDIDPEVFNSISEKQQRRTLVAHDFAKALGYDIEVVNGNKKNKNAHGYRVKSTGKIVLDAGEGKNPVLQTLVHEITHSLEGSGRYEELKALIKSDYTEDQWKQLVVSKQANYKNIAKQDLSIEEAEREIVARAVEEKIQDDENFLDDLVRYNFSMASRIHQNMKSFFSEDETVNFKNSFEKVFKGARTEMIAETMNAIKSGFSGMVGDNYVSPNDLQLSAEQYDVTGREILDRFLSDPANGISTEAKNAILDRMEEIYKVMRDFQETGKFPEFSDWQDMYYTIDDRGELSVVINNGDYELNIDFSTVCKKRKMLDKVINALSKNGYLAKALKNTEIAKIRDIIKKHEFEVACGMCFVDTKRFNQGSWAGKFEVKWNGLIDQLSAVMDLDENEVSTFNFQAGLTKGTPGLQNIDFSDPRLASFVAKAEGGSEEARMVRALMNNPDLRSKVSTNDLYGSKGFEALQQASPELFKLVNASGGSSKPKLAHTEVTYFNEIINSPKFNPEEAKKVGGVRLQSFSDFMANMVFDYVQMFADMEAKQLTGHSYTKVKEYALLFGKTGMKINLSLIPAGFDPDVYTAEQIAGMKKKSKEFLKLKENAGLKENGDYMFDDESFDFDLAVEIQNLDGYDKNVGTICVGVSDKHILKMLDDDRICMIIPYHRSGISPLVADKMGISTFNDYTNKQNTRMRGANGRLRKIGKNFDFNFYEGSDVNGKHFAGMIENNYDAKKTADSYLAWCKENDYVPKFGDNPEIVNHKNYYKLLIDFRAYDKNGNVAPQVPVKISGDSGIGTDFVLLDTEKNPTLAKLYGDDIGFKNVLEKGLDVYEETEKEQNEQVDPIMQEVVEELGLSNVQMSVDDTQFDISETAQKAVEEFGTTNDYRKAGYILADGSYLDLSEGQDRRMQDHRSVGVFYDGIDYSREGMSAGLIRFMNEGNVRISPESGGIDISRLSEPTSAQYRQIGEFLRNYRDDWHALDVSYEDGSKVFSVEYPPFTPANQVISDIRDYFENGIIPEQSDTDDGVQFDLATDMAVEGNREARDNLNKTIDDLYKGILPTKRQVIYAQAPQIIQEYGAHNYPLVINHHELVKAVMHIDEARAIGHKVEDGKNYHNLGKEGFNKAIDNISEPVMIMKRDGKLTVFTETIDYKGNQVIVPIRINTGGQENNHWEQYNIALSVHGKTSINNFIKNQLKGGAVFVYTDKKKIQELNASGRVQYSSDIIPVILSVNNEEHKVKNSAHKSLKEQSKSYNTAVANGDMETAQRIIDERAREYARETGQKVFKVFHGTNARFNKFLREKLGSKNIFASSAYKAFFSAGSKSTAESYMGLTTADMIRLNFSKEAEQARNEIIKKYNLEELRAQDKEARNRYFEDAIRKAFADENDYEAQAYRRATDPENINQVKSSSPEFFTDDVIKELQDTARIHWQNKNDRVNILNDEYDRTSELHKRLAKLEKKASEDYEQYGLSALGYDPNIKELYAFMKNPLVHDFKGEEKRDESFSDLIDQAIAQGKDGVIFENVRDGGGFDTIYAVFEPNQYKSADPVTYDDDGNIIPLEKRFNQDTDDLRFSLNESSDNSLPAEAQEPSEPEVTTEQADDNLIEFGSTPPDGGKTAKLMDELPKGPTFKERLKRAFETLRHELADHLDAIEDLARQTKNREIIAKADYAMLAPNVAGEVLTNCRRDLQTGEVIGKSLTKILEPIAQNNRQDFYMYLYHYRNIDSSSLRSRLGEQYQNKYVFGDESGIGTKESTQFINDMEKAHPEFKNVAEEVWQFFRQNLQVLKDGGVISQRDYGRYIKETPHYVPIQRNVDVQRAGAKATDPNKSIRHFEGSDIDILPFEYSAIKHTNNAYRSAFMNNLHKEIYATLAHGVEEVAVADDIDDLIEYGFETLSNKSGYKMYVYRKGKKYSLNIDERLYNSLSPRHNPNNWGDLKGLTNLSEFRRNLITGWNPVFWATNGLKDIQDAMYNTKFSVPQFLSAYKQAWGQILSNGKYKQLYISAGGGNNSYFRELDQSKPEPNTLLGLAKKTGNKALQTIININEAVEMAPRLAEFIASMKNGSSLEEAMYNSAEVTTNFKRGGGTAKWINRNGVAFFNASIQGFEKQVRNYKDARDGGTKAMATYMAKIALTSGLPLLILNGLVWRKDKDYEELSDYIKDNYYIVGKTKDGKFIRIPKGRISAFYQTVMQNGIDTVQGKVNMWDALLDDYQSFKDNLAPNSVDENFIGAPVIQAVTNKSWYGEDIVPSRLQDLPDSEQYDETTDWLSIKIGELSAKVAKATGSDLFELSPYKVNYVLDQYSGAIGDIGLPMITLSANNSINNKFVSGLVSPVLDRFTTDPVLKNQNVSTFYDLKDKLTTKAKSRNATDEQVLANKYLNSISAKMGELYAQKREIQGSSLPNSEKMAQVREIQEQINDYARTGLANYDQIDITDKYATVGDVRYYQNADGAWNKPTEKALEKLNNANLSDEDRSAYFETSGNITAIRKDIKDKTPEGKDANYTEATINAISSSKLSDKGKNTLFDSYYDSKLTNHINNMGLSDKVKYDVKVATKLAEGKKDSNGKTIANSKAEAVAEAYRGLGVLDDVLQYIKDNDVNPSEMGLSKTVYNKLVNGSSGYQSAYNSSFGSKRSTGKGSGKSSTKKPSPKKLPNFTAPKTDTAKFSVKDFSKSYYQAMRTGNKLSANTSSTTVTCPNCGNKVRPYNGRCPICGADL